MDRIMSDGGDQTGKPRTPGLRNIRQPNLQNRVYELLLNMIIDGKYRDNEMLPSERILCEELGVSRTVIRESMKSLQARGVLTAIHGKGIRVAPAVGTDISEAFMLYLRRQHRDVPLEDLSEVRFALETRSAACAAERASDAEVAELREILDRMPGSTSSLELYVQADMDFHLKLAHLTHNMLFVTIVESLLFPLQRSFKKSFEGDSAQLYREHLGIYTCVERHDAEGARAAMLSHLERATRALHPGGG
jgi:DNA-binding FadR family transcriptional regulator